MDYVKMLRMAANPTMPTSLVSQEQPERLPLKITPDGFPYLDTGYDNSEYTKKLLEGGFSHYLGQHYKLANNSRERRVPYKAISTNVSTFIPPECLPPQCEIRHPRNMEKETIRGFFDHIFRRQIEHGYRNAFRFKIVQTSRGVKQAQYPDTNTLPMNAGAGAYLDPNLANPGAGPGAYLDPNLANPGAGAGISFAAAMTPSAPLSQQLSLNGTPETEYVRVDMAEMDRLCKAGVQRPPAVNGPAHGPPEFLIEASIYHEYSQSGTGPSPPPPAPAPRPLRKKRSRMSADALAMKEADISLKTRQRKLNRRK
jgi:hypothetical protein